MLDLAAGEEGGPSPGAAEVAEAGLSAARERELLDALGAGRAAG